MDRSINAKQLRASLPQIVRRVQKGERFLVLYRSRPAFRVVPVEPGDLRDEIPLSEDPIYRAEAVGRSTDGLTSADHDKLLYGTE
jgi:prevent-host-death family protein